MAGCIAVLQAEARWRETLRSEIGRDELELKSFQEPEELYGALREQPRELHLVVLSVAVRDPVNIAHHVQGLDAELEVLVLCEGERYPDLKQILSISPFVGSQVRCCVDGPPQTLAAELGSAARRTRARRRHRAWLAAARRSLSVEEGPLRSVQILDRILNQAPIGVILLGLDGRVISYNDAVGRITEVREREVLGARISDIFPESVQLGVGKLMDKAVSSSDEPIGWETFEIRNGVAGSRYLRINGSVVTARGNQQVILMLVEDITAAKRREEALRESREELRFVTGKLLTAHEDERLRLARELHDDLTQRLAMLALEVGMLEQRVDRNDELREDLGRIRKRAAGISTDVHKLSRQLHPSILSHLGLADAMESECTRFSELEELPIDFIARNVPESLPREVSLCLYRVLQEALRNVVKHSRAGGASVGLTGGPERLHLSIRDSGIGFDFSGARKHGGVGLASMEERVNLIGGSLSVESQTGHGTAIEVRVSLPAKTGSNAG